MSQKTTSEWIEQARKKHGDKYDYSNSIYVDWKTKIKIICPKHGEFWQDPSSHLKGCNCPKCTNSPAGLILEERKQNFIKKANLLYGNIYDYSKINYQGKRKKVCIICPEHGEFWQTPERHLQNGCPKCSRIVNKCKLHDKNLLDFISKSKKIFNNKYDYSKVKYVNSNIKVQITCPEHGDFYQTPLSHLKGYECPKCMKIKNKKKIQERQTKKIKKCNIKYDFQKMDYVDIKTPIVVVCPEHGEFWISPHSLIKGCGCPKCNKTHKKTTEEFIIAAKKIHNDKYDYSKTNYINAHTKVCIICPEHGEFWQKANSHLNGQGCSFCAHKVGKHKEKFSKRFIEKAKMVHGEKYDYSKVEYINNTTKVCIICPEHGEFWQVPSYHNNGNGCPKCSMSWLERDIMLFLEKNNYTYEYQKKFKWLNRMTLDFFIPDYNIAIECQGEQHFRAINYFGGVEKLKTQQKRDEKKRRLCEKNNIKLFYYSTPEFKEYAYCDITTLFNEIIKK